MGLAWPQWAQPLLKFPLPAARHSGPPPRHCGVQGLCLLWIEFAAAQLEPLGVQPDPQFMLFACAGPYMPRPVRVYLQDAYLCSAIAPELSCGEFSL